MNLNLTFVNMTNQNCIILGNNGRNIPTFFVLQLLPYDSDVVVIIAMYQLYAGIS